MIDNYATNDMRNLITEISAEITNSFKLYFNDGLKFLKLD